MNTEALSSGIVLLSSAITAIKQAIDLLPDGSKKQAAADALERAEREFKIAEAKSAQNMGYEICKKHFPPVVMLSNDDTNWECPECGNKLNNAYFG